MRLNLLLRSNNGPCVNPKLFQTEVLCYLHCVFQSPAARIPAWPLLGWKKQGQTPLAAPHKSPHWMEKHYCVSPGWQYLSELTQAQNKWSWWQTLTPDLVNPSVLSLSYSVKKLKCCGGQYFFMVLDRLCPELINVTQSFANRLDFSVVFFVFLLPALGSDSWHSKELVFRNYLLYVIA